MISKVEIHVGWSERDQIYLAWCDLYEYLMAHGDTPGEAYDEFEELLRMCASV